MGIRKTNNALPKLFARKVVELDESMQSKLRSVINFVREREDEILIGSWLTNTSTTCARTYLVFPTISIPLALAVS